ncbi:unnamed protein product [Chrysodeixis includens]|uniref:Translin-associated protein X n=1 Tax=Chrysodeixis includens TaxID=689277 RepID=A0A9P0BMM0_CHRIL|nr:unnamed protein product [Chrysodeixis includens]
MPGPGRHYRGNRKAANPSAASLSTVARESALALPDDSPVLAIFKDIALKLTARQDRHERLVKLSRDITIESKRIIFVLHSAMTKEANAKVLADANDRIQKLLNGPIKSIGIELEYSPAYLHLRAVTSGFQEFVEARTMFSIMATGQIITFPEVQKELEFVVTENDEQRKVVTMITDNDYMLGLADLTGELMRKAINSVSTGESEDCIQACQVVRDLYTGYLGITNNRHLLRKLTTTRTNVNKVEMAVYALRVRGSGPGLMAAGNPPAPDIDAPAGLSDDEGYY